MLRQYSLQCSVAIFLPAISGWKQWWCHISYDACVRRTTTSVEFWLVLWTPIRSDTPKVDHVSMICFRLYCCGCHRFIYFSKECLAYKLIPWYNKNCVLLQISFFFFQFAINLLLFRMTPFDSSAVCWWRSQEFK